MIYITVDQHTGGRAGHKLKDIVSAYILAKLYNWNLCRHRSWNHYVLKPFGIELNLPIVQDLVKNIDDIHTHIFRPPELSWGGMTLNQVEELYELAINLEKKHKNIIIILSNVARIHLDQVDNWHQDGRIKFNVYSEVVKDLKNRFQLVDLNRLPDKHLDINQSSVKVAVHIRRGDLGHVLQNQDFNSVKYYKSLISNLRAILPVKLDINIYSERKNAEDIKELAGENVKIHLGRSFENDFKDMLTAHILIPASSGMSSWAIYLCHGLVLCPPVGIKHFRHINKLDKVISVNKAGEILDIDKFLNKFSF